MNYTAVPFTTLSASTTQRFFYPIPLEDLPHEVAVAVEATFATYDAETTGAWPDVQGAWSRFERNLEHAVRLLGDYETASPDEDVLLAQLDAWAPLLARAKAAMGGRT